MVDVVDESTVLNKARLTLKSVLVDEVVNFMSIKPNIQSTNTGAESSLSDPSFTEFIEV